MQPSLNVASAWIIPLRAVLREKSGVWRGPEGTMTEPTKLQRLLLVFAVRHGRVDAESGYTLVLGRTAQMAQMLGMPAILEVRARHRARGHSHRQGGGATATGTSEQPALDWIDTASAGRYRRSDGWVGSRGWQASLGWVMASRAPVYVRLL